MTGAVLGEADAAAKPARDTRPLVLVVDDEESYRQALAAGLSREGFAVELAADGHEALRLFHRTHPDLILLDLMLPDQSGVELCQRIRPWPPSRSSWSRPATRRSTSSWASSSGRRTTCPSRSACGSWWPACAPCCAGGSTPRHRRDDVVHAGPVSLDNGRREVTVHGQPVDLSRKEFDLLALLMAHAGQVVTREWCIDRLWWDQDLSDTRTLDTHVKRLRRKLEPDPRNPRHLVTVRGVGFRFEA